MKKLCIIGPNNQQTVQRICNQAGQLINPTLPEILAISEKVKITFADLIKQVMHTGNPQYVVHDNQPNPKDIITHQGTRYNLIRDEDLAALNALHQVNWATQDIIKYIQRTPSIKCVRFTRKPDSVWENQWNQIEQANYGGRTIYFGRIHTPAGVGIAEAGMNPATALARRWLHHTNPKRRFCKDWIEKYVINPNGFNYPEYLHRLND